LFTQNAGGGSVVDPAAVKKYGGYNRGGWDDYVYNPHYVEEKDELWEQFLKKLTADWENKMEHNMLQDLSALNLSSSGVKR